MGHSKHEYVPIGEVVDAQKAEIQEMLAEVEKSTVSLGKATSDITSVLKAVQDRKAKATLDIDSAFNFIYDMLRARQKEAHNHVAALSMQKEKLLQAQAEALTASMTNIESCAEYVRRALELGSNSEIMLSKPMLDQRLVAVQQQENTLDPVATAELWLDKDVETLQSAIATFCTAHVPTVASEQCTAEGGGLQADQVCVGSAAEFTVSLRDADGEVAEMHGAARRRCMCRRRRRRCHQHC
jgi:hypothetical protein